MFFHRLIIETSAELEKLKQGHYDNQYKEVIIEGTASSDLLLEPQYFANTTFPRISFIEQHDPKFNLISLYNTVQMKKGAYAGFASGKNSLEGLPKDYLDYIVDFTWYAKPTDSNINTILGWRTIQKLYVGDKVRGDLVLTFSKRIDELSKLTDLSELKFDIDDRTYLKVNVGTFIDNLTSLKKLVFHDLNLRWDERKKFLEKNPVPSNWRITLISPFIKFEKNEL